MGDNISYEVVKDKTENFLKNELQKARSGVDNFNTIINK